jgi:hypothetical protein
MITRIMGLDKRVGNADRELSVLVEKVDKETREVRHTLKNVQSRADAIKLLVQRMREL